MNDDIIRLENHAFLSFLEDSSTDYYENEVAERISVFKNNRSEAQKKILVWLGKYKHLTITKLAKHLKISEARLRDEISNFPSGWIYTKDNEIILDDFIYNRTKEEIIEQWKSRDP